MIRSRSSAAEEAGGARGLPRRLSLWLALLALLLGLFVLPFPAYGAGELDPTFDGDGRVVTDFGESDGAHGIAIQADGKIVVAGGDGADFALARYNPDGSLDPSFDGDGRVVTDFGADDRARGVAIQSDGKIVAAGTGGSGNPYGFALARYSPNGSLDPTFDGDGRVVTDFGAGDVALDVAIQPNGKIVAVGGGDVTTNRNFALARYNPDGSLDPTFDGDGRVVTDFGWNDVALDVAIQPNGKIVAVGDGTAGGDPDNFVLARYSPDGSLDPTFDGDGRVVTDFGDHDIAVGVAIQANVKIVVAGQSGSAPNPPIKSALARYNLDGSLDPTFDGDGKVVTDFVGNYFASHVAIQADGRIVAAGSNDAGLSDNFALARYNPDGRLDPGFGGDGTVVTDFGGATDSAFGVAIQADGKIVAAGQSGSGPNPFNFALARYLPGVSCFGVPATLVGTAGNDHLIGTAGNDVIVGLGGNDTISGLGGNDKICGGPGTDILAGTGGNDSLTGGTGADTINGGSGVDTASYAAYTNGVKIDIDGVADDGNAADGPPGARDNVRTDVENLFGGYGADALTGSAANNRLTGRSGADSLLGLGGNDSLFANDGTADAQIDCDGGAADTAHVDGADPATVGCETVGP